MDRLGAQHISPEGVGSKEGHVKGLLLREVAQGDEHSIGEPHVGGHLQPNEPVARWRLIGVQDLARVKELDPRERVSHSPGLWPSSQGPQTPPSNTLKGTEALDQDRSSRRMKDGDERIDAERESKKTETVSATMAQHRAEHHQV